MSPGLGDLDPGARAAIETIVELLAADPAAPTAVTDAETIGRVHVADSLSGLVFEELAGASRICDVGAGAGLPGLVLAAALPDSELVLLDSITRKCEFMKTAAAAAELTNVTVVDDRAESFARLRPADFDAVTARAVGRLSTLAELASPLLADRGVLVAWKGRRDTAEEAELGRAAEGLAMRPERILWVGPYAGSENRHLHLIRKSGPTPEDLPRRPGMAKKRPRGRA